MYYDQKVELTYVKVSGNEVAGNLPQLKIDGRVVKEGCTPDLRMIMDYVEKAGVCR
jgi:hypothetical protein